MLLERKCKSVSDEGMFGLLVTNEGIDGGARI